MATNERDERKAGITPAATTEPDNGDPRDTDHPTGSKQAAENRRQRSTKLVATLENPAVVRHQLFGEGSQFDVRVLGVPSQRVEGRLVIHPVEQDEHAFRLVDHCPVLCNFCNSGGYNFCNSGGYVVAGGALQWGVQSESSAACWSKPLRVSSSESKRPVRRMFVGITGCLVPLCSRARIRTMETLGRASGSLTFGLNTNACRAVGMLCT